MKRLLLIIVFFLSFLLSHAQKILRLDIQRPFRIKEISFYTKDRITLKVKSSKKIIYGTILAIGDSGIVVSNKKSSDTVAIKQIRLIILNHTNYLTESFSYVFTIAGVGIMGIDAVNNLLNYESPIIKTSIVKTGVGLIATGIIIKIIPKRRHKIGKRKKLKVTNLSPY